MTIPRDNKIVRRVVGESFEEKLERAPHLRQCPGCGHTWPARAQKAGSIKRQIRCPKCHRRIKP